MNSKKAAAIAGVTYYLQQEADMREQEAEALGNRARRSGWSAYGRNAVARGRAMVQGRRIRRNINNPGSRGYRPGMVRSCEPERLLEPAAVPHAHGMQIKE